MSRRSATHSWCRTEQLSRAVQRHRLQRRLRPGDTAKWVQMLTSNSRSRQYWRSTIPPPRPSSHHRFA